MQIDILTFDAASGHKSAAEAIRRQLSVQMPHADVRVIDLEDVLKSQTRLIGAIYRTSIGYFNWCMRRESYFLFPTTIRTSIWFARILCSIKPLRFLLRWTSSFWKDRRPDAIVSVTPMMHTLVYESARIVNPDVRCITVPVDFCEMTPGYWFQSAVRQEYLLGCDQLFLDAESEQVDPAETHRLSGMAVDPLFYDQSPIDRVAFHAQKQLDPNLPTGVISFGGQGTINVLRCAQRIADANIPVNLICLTGRNQNLRERVEAMDSPYPIVAQPFTPEPPVAALRMAAFLIGKPGTMTLTESLITGVPFIFVKSTGLDCVQQANEKWVLQQGIGIQADTPDHVDDAVRNVLASDSIMQNIERAQHDGIFDLTANIERLIQSVNTTAVQPNGEQDLPRAA